VEKDEHSFIVVKSFSVSISMDQTQSFWDERVQQPHGGQSWRLCGRSFVEDFSVTTNGLGSPKAAVEAAHNALAGIHHYPAADCGDAVEALASFIQWPASKLLLGNGASELIDLVMRAAPPGPHRVGPYPAAYMEYQRSADITGRRTMPWGDPAEAAVTVIIRPNSPTGDLMSLAQLESVVTSSTGITVVDESFLCFEGCQWRESSALGLVDKFPDRLIVIQSWTKIWSCPGLRLGSVACSDSWYIRLKSLQTPWSCNSIAQAFCVAAARDFDYLNVTRSTLTIWKRRHLSLIIDQLGWKANLDCPEWVPWIFVDCDSEEVAQRASQLAQQAGCPVRWCASYGTPRFLRLGIRHPDAQDALMAAWTPLQHGS